MLNIGCYPLNDWKKNAVSHLSSICGPSVKALITKSFRTSFQLLMSMMLLCFGDYHDVSLTCNKFWKSPYLSLFSFHFLLLSSTVLVSCVLLNNILLLVQANAVTCNPTSELSTGKVEKKNNRMLKRDFGMIWVHIDLLTGLAHCYFMLYLSVPYFKVLQPVGWKYWK